MGGAAFHVEVEHAERVDLHVVLRALHVVLRGGAGRGMFAAGRGMF
jgi:hypothetical protein